MVCKEGPQHVLDLARTGAKFTTRRSGELHLTQEGGHSARRVVHAEDATGISTNRSHDFLCGGQDALCQATGWEWREQIWSLKHHCVCLHFGALSCSRQFRQLVMANVIVRLIIPQYSASCSAQASIEKYFAGSQKLQGCVFAVHFTCTYFNYVLTEAAIFEGLAEIAFTSSCPLSGREIERALLEQARAHPKISFYEHHLATDLVLDEVMGQPICLGADILDQQSFAMTRFVAPVTFLATGGAGQVEILLPPQYLSLHKLDNP